MNPEARRIIQLARQARTPSAEDRRRVRAAVAIGVAAAAVTVPAVAAGGGAGFSAKIAGAMGVFTGIRGIVAGMVIASTSVGAGAYLWKHASAARVVEAPVVSSVPPVAAPVALPPPVSIPEPAAAPVVTPNVREAPGRARVAAPDPLAAELTLLHAAKQAWQDGNSQTALDLAQKHAKLYPHSQLASERDALKVFALCGLGRANDARDLAQALLSKAPGSPFRASLEQSCAMRQVTLP